MDQWDGSSDLGSKGVAAMSGVSNLGATASADFLQREVTIDSFRQAMRGLAGGVAVVTVGIGPDRTGFTSTSVESLSAEPPRLLVSVSENSSSWKQLQKCPYFGVNILRAHHLGIAEQFAGRGGLQGVDRYLGARWTTLASAGAAILDDALAGVDCIVEELLPRHGHVIIIGRVRAILLHTDGQPLLYWQGAYRQIVHNQPDQHK
jgi:flavin reductase (DIM6/NTAB) family NADH-FMN oxidoreductase RutF